MKPMIPLLAALIVILGAIPVLAEKVPISPEELRKTATHVVTGQVAAIYERTVRDQNWETTYYVAEVKVNECEKGDALKKGDLMYVRYWHRGWISKEPPRPDTNGHRGLPTVGETLRIYTARHAYDGFSNSNNDGGYNVIGANGFEKLKPANDKK